ncbi:MAG: hypothetical protein PHE33_00740 [Bacteroidales bacterium]|nr:hypothetical protein [Bacteroidales bacterium]
MIDNYLNIGGIALICTYLLIAAFIFNLYANTHYNKDLTTKKYFLYGFYFKMFVAIFFALIYDQYYNRGGDTFSYFYGASRMGDVLFKDPLAYFKMFFGFITESNVYDLPANLGYFPSFRDPSVYAVHRFISPFTILGFKNYYLTIIVLNVMNYIIIWRAFMFFKKIFPTKEKILAIGLLFIPSVAFWGSGIVKDSFTYTFALVFIVSFYKLFFLRKIGILNLVKIIISVYIIISLKPYILYALLAGGFTWMGFKYILMVKSKVLRVFVFPVIMLAVAFGGMYVLTGAANIAGGSYKDVDSMLSKAVISQQDLKQDYYGGNSFDIGDFDPTIGGAASVTPAAIIAGLYRPFLWEANSVVMLLSGLENMILLLLTIYVLLRAGPVFFLKQLAKEPFLIFCFVFTLIMAMGIGLSTSNFGALVRFKIPLIPFFLMGWLFVLDEYRKSKRIKNG